MYARAQKLIEYFPLPFSENTAFDSDEVLSINSSEKQLEKSNLAIKFTTLIFDKTYSLSSSRPVFEVFGFQ